MQIITSLFIVVLIAFRYIFYDELEIAVEAKYYFYYILLTIIITLAEIPLDILATNIVECWSGLKMSEKISEYKAIFNNKKTVWAIDDTSHYTNATTKDRSLIINLGFSYQYYLILSINCFSAICFMIGIELISITNYNPLYDNLMTAVTFGLIAYLIFVFWAIKKIFRKVDLKKENPNFITNLTELEEMLNYRRNLVNADVNIYTDEIEFLNNHLKLNEKYRATAEQLMERVNKKSKLKYILLINIKYF
jgi:hypothetical protein